MGFAVTDGDTTEYSAQAAVFGAGDDYINGLRPGGWSENMWAGFNHIVFGGCGTKPAEQVIEESSQNGIVGTVGHQFALTAQAAPTTVTFKIDGEPLTVRPSDSNDARIAHEQLDLIRPECGPFSQLIYNTSFAIGTVGKAHAFQHQTYRTWHEIVKPGALTPRWHTNSSTVQGRKPDWWDWKQQRAAKPVPVAEVSTLLWPDPTYLKDPLLIWRHAARFIEIFDRVQLAIDMQLTGSLAGGIMFFEGYTSKGGDQSEPKTVTDLKRRVREVEKGKTTLEPIFAGGTKAPTMLFPVKDVQEVLFKAGDFAVQGIGRLGPIEMGTVAGGEASGSYWQASIRDRMNVQRNIVPIRMWADLLITEWVFKPRLRKLYEAGLFGTDPETVAIGHDMDAVVNRPDNATEMVNIARLGAVGMRALRRVAGAKESDAPTPEELATIQQMTGRAPSEIADQFGDYDPDPTGLFGEPQTEDEIRQPDTLTLGNPRQAAAAAEPVDVFAGRW